jgi:2-hydroxychromene-2-carboxylate isomerase
VESYRRWFVDGQEPASEPNLSASLAEAGQDTTRTVARADGDDVIETYEGATTEARKLGVFGSPTSAGGKLTWGDDRLDDAICWLRHGRLQA